MTGSAEHEGAEWLASPNFGPRRDGLAPEILLIHYTGMATGQAAQDWLCNPASEVSCHYILHEDGRIVQMVREADRAWHAGRSWWQGQGDVNSRSIGIEIVNVGHEGGLPPFPDRQIAALIALSRGIKARHGIADALVLAHSDVAPGRKIDPGERFPWADLAREGVGLHVPPAPLRSGSALSEGDRGGEVAQLQKMLAAYGYQVPVHGDFDGETRKVVEAFQRHFRPARVDGVADSSTRDTLAMLSEAVRQTGG
ncbi:MAG: N-acetylmuramoyl-L-alanine amidase [Rhizobiaceae bacterium]